MMLLHFALFVVTSLTLIGFLSQLGYWPDLAAHFRLQYLAILILCVLFYIFKKKWKFLAVASIAAITNLALIAPLYIPASHPQPYHGKIISIMLINVHSSNVEYDKVFDYINELKPDILALEEINDRWISNLGPLLDAYPYKALQSRPDNFGIGLYSKIPTEDMKIVYFGSVRVPSVLAIYTIYNVPVTLLFTHPVPPGNWEYFQKRNEQLQAISSQRNTFGEKLILVGDLNMTSWSAHFKEFVQRMDLTDTRKGFGLQITWPTMLPIMGITIDHILVSKNIKVLERTVGPHIGSDHYPVYIKLGVE